MDNSIATRQGEIHTNTSLPIPPPSHADDYGYSRPPVSEPISQPPGSPIPPENRLLNFFRGYGAALVLSLPVLPIVVSAVTIVIYLSNTSMLGWFSIAIGAASTYILWLLVSLLLVPLTSPRNANSRSFGLLESRHEQLQSRLNVLNQMYPYGSAEYKALPEYQKTALNEAHDKLDEICGEIDESNTRLAWTLGYGYVNVWGMLHRAEEALVEIEPLQVTLRGAVHDKMAISNSQMSNRDELLAKLRFAAKKLDPSMIGLFKPLAVPVPPDDNDSPDIQQLEKDVQQIADHVGVKLHRGHAGSSSDSDGDGKASRDGGDEARARLIMREVRRSLNDYRDRLWEGLLRARNNLLGVTFVTSVGTHILLCIAILALPVNTASHATIIAAVSYYMLGAIAGLFGRISQATLANIAVDDYGLTLAQVISRPLYSGLAGLGGVLLSSTVLGITTTNTVQSVFASVRVDYLIVAAAFGLTPNLIAGGLQNQSNRLLSALRASKTTISDKTVNNDSGQNAGE